MSKLVRRKAIEHPRIDATLGSFLALMIRYALIILVLIVVLQQFGVQTTSLVAVVGASALAIGLALQGTLTNVASGIMVAIIRPYHLGDFVEINGKEGIVTDLDLFFTTLRSPDERIIKVPNGQATSNPIVNHSKHGIRRCIIGIGIGYDDDIDQAFAVMREIGVDAHLAIGATVQPGERVPQFRDAPVEAEPAGGLDSGMKQIDRDLLARLPALVAQLAGGQRGCRDGALRGSTDGKR